MLLLYYYYAWHHSDVSMFAIYHQVEGYPDKLRLQTYLKQIRDQSEIDFRVKSVGCVCICHVYHK